MGLRPQALHSASGTTPDRVLWGRIVPYTSAGTTRREDRTQSPVLARFHLKRMRRSNCDFLSRLIEKVSAIREKGFFFIVRHARGAGHCLLVSLVPGGLPKRGVGAVEPLAYAGPIRIAGSAWIWSKTI